MSEKLNEANVGKKDSKIEKEEKRKHLKNYPFTDELDRLLNNGVSRDTPYYETINIYKYC